MSFIGVGLALIVSALSFTKPNGDLYISNAYYLNNSVCVVTDYMQPIGNINSTSGTLYINADTDLSSNSVSINLQTYTGSEYYGQTRYKFDYRYSLATDYNVVDEYEFYIENTSYFENINGDIEGVPVDDTIDILVGSTLLLYNSNRELITTFNTNVAYYGFHLNGAETQERNNNTINYGYFSNNGLRSNGSNIDISSCEYFSVYFNFSIFDDDYIDTSSTDRYLQGYQEGYSNGEQEGYSNGYQEGYSNGYTDAGTSDTNNIITTILNGVDSFMAIEFLPGIKLRYIIGVPLVIALVFFVLKAFR